MPDKKPRNRLKSRRRKRKKKGNILDRWNPNAGTSNKEQEMKLQKHASLINLKGKHVLDGFKEKLDKDKQKEEEEKKKHYEEQVSHAHKMEKIVMPREKTFRKLPESQPS